MKGSGPKYERETIINFNEEEETASVWTPVSQSIEVIKTLGAGLFDLIVDSDS
jgi:hypothetical protein